MGSGDASPNRGRGRLRKLLLRYAVTLVVVVAAGYVLVRSFDVGAALGTLRGADPLWTALAVVSFYATFPVRTRRWRRFLADAGVDVDPLPANLVLVVGFYLNVLVPAKLGDLYRSYMTAREYAGSVSRVLGTIAAERIVDLVLLAVGLIVFLSVLLRQREVFAPRLFGLAVVMLLVLAVGTAVLLLADRVPLPERVRELVARFRDGTLTATAGVTGDRRTVLGLSVGIWALNVVRTALVARALGVALTPLEVTLLALVVAFLSGLPSVPAGIGIVEVIGSGFLVTLGLTTGDALALVLLDRFITVVTFVVVGTVVYLYLVYVEGFGRVSERARAG